ncbi:hypothetical protein M758_6G065200 [Ceratodon purpureus]|uniref:Uncharacterized protein n=1 Tax=Ceratodon purpureus TaxID=3225 RepID=A0A8T0HBC9_CERPU|nr:hypothetical protein KC19_6G069300 [Ceratodon purpureus]KAG0612950.1 hypothetical protein M758_6G065200 [Ceratodon purpureus]
MSINNTQPKEFRSSSIECYTECPLSVPSSSLSVRLDVYDNREQMERILAFLSMLDQIEHPMTQAKHMWQEAKSFHTVRITQNISFRNANNI